jgi:hypothetical protein
LRIPTLEEVLEEQEDLESLCADRELKTKEIFQGNAYYGNDQIIKAYAGFTEEYPLKFVIPHGIVFSETHFWERELTCNLPAILCYQKDRSKAYRGRLKRAKKVIITASPFTYIPELIDKNGSIKTRRGTIFFPAHSTQNVTSEMDYDALAEKLVSLDEDYQPITVCIYWKDYNDGAYKAFENRGLRIVSAGHIFDSEFLFRLYQLCSQHEYSACNRIGSHMFYAQYAGCKHFFIESCEIKIKAEDIDIKKQVNFDVYVYQDKFKQLFVSPDSYAEEKNTLMDEYLGFRLRPSKLGLRNIIIRTELSYQNRKLIEKGRKIIFSIANRLSFKP